MDPQMAAETGSILTVLGLFALGVLSPGPNFLVVVQSSMSRGWIAGFVTGLGVALGDAIYASAGLLGAESFLIRGGPAATVVRVVGGLYLTWLGVAMMTTRSGSMQITPVEANREDLARCFIRGLLTDLSNPKTILFFASIFAVAYVPGGRPLVPVVTLMSIVGFSILWRAGLSWCFSRAAVREIHGRLGSLVTRLCGAFLAWVGLRFLLEE